MTVSPERKSLPAAFTLVEMLVSMAVLLLIVVVLVSITSQTTRTWRYTSGKVEEFREARTAFETVTSRLRQATLNTYWDYRYDPATGLPKSYERRSELRFISGPASTLQIGTGPNGQRVTHAVFFHAPLGMVNMSSTSSTSPSYRGLENLLNVWGYFVELDSDKAFRPELLNATTPPIPERIRFRLMEFRQPSEALATYDYTSGTSGSVAAAVTYNRADWYLGGQYGANATGSSNGSTGLAAYAAPAQPIAENIVALVLTPRLSRQDEVQLQGSANSDYSVLAPNYLYDSTASSSNPAINPKNQLPPVMQVTMVAIDEASAVRLRLSASNFDIFSLSPKFSDTRKYSSDLKTAAASSAATSTTSLEDTLISMHVNYRIFTSNVTIRAAKWSREQTN